MEREEKNMTKKSMKKEEKKLKGIETRFRS